MSLNKFLKNLNFDKLKKFDQNTSPVLESEKDADIFEMQGYENLKGKTFKIKMSHIDKSI